MSYLQIESRHKEFFGLICYHDYYTDLLCKDFIIEPTPETVQLMRNYYLIHKPLDFGFLMTYSPEESPQRLKHAPEKLRFSFTMRLKNKRFVNFTDIPFHSDWQAFHFSNLNAGTSAIDKEISREVYYYFKQLNVVDSQKKLLHLQELTEVNLKPQRFNYDVIREGLSKNPVGYDKINLYDEWGEDVTPRGKPIKKGILDVRKIEVDRYLYSEQKKLKKAGLEDAEIEAKILEIKKDVAGKLRVQKFGSHPLNFRHLPYGKYTVEVGKNRKDVYISEKPEERLFGMIDIHLDAADVNQLINRDGKTDADVMQPKLYHMHFRARETHWRYFFMNHKSSRVKPKMVKEENEMLSFTDPINTRLENLGSHVMLSESNTAIKLRERPEYILLLERRIGKRNMKDLRLPVPSVDLIKPMKVDGETKIYSDVYVYL